jgi:hypothetical protein
MLHAVCLEANPSDVGARRLLKDAQFLANHFSRHGIYPPGATLEALEQSGTGSGISTVFDVSMRRVVLYKPSI